MESHEDCLAAADAKGLVVVYPNDNELLVDLDTEAQGAIFDRAIWVLRSMFPAENTWRTRVQWRRRPSPSGEPHHLHVTVTLPRAISQRERILLQACLGSDPMREILSLQRLEAGNPHPTLFFERPATGEVPR